MKQICIDDKPLIGDKLLTYGKTYEVSTYYSNDDMVKVFCDRGYEINVAKKRFADTDDWRDRQLDSIE